MHKTPFKQWMHNTNPVCEIQVLAAECCCCHEVVCKKFVTFQASYLLVIRSLAKVTMSGAPYKSAKEWGRCFSSVYFNHEGVPVSCLQSSKRITGQKKSTTKPGKSPYPTIQWCHEYLDRGISEMTRITHPSTSQSVIIAILGYTVVLAQVKIFFYWKIIHPHTNHLLVKV